MTDRRLANLRAALGFLQLAPRAHELRLLHRWLDTWTGLGLIVVGVERPGPAVVAQPHRGTQATFMASPMLSPEGFGVAPTPWEAVQMAAWTATSARHAD